MPDTTTLTLDTMAMLAERELHAFATAVERSFGNEEAVRAAEDWIEEALASRDLLESAHAWRQITCTAASRLADRVTRENRCHRVQL